MKSFMDVVHKYRLHPDFIGRELTSPDQAGGSGDSLVHIVSRKGDLESLQTLIAIGSNPSLKGDHDNTPLHYAAMNDCRDAVMFLLTHGADTTIQNDFGFTPGDYARQFGHNAVAGLLE